MALAAHPAFSSFNGSLFNHSCHPNVNIGWKSFSSDDQEVHETLKQLNKSNDRVEIDDGKPSVGSAGHNDLDNPFSLDNSGTIGYFKTNRSIEVGEELTISYVDVGKDCTVKKESWRLHTTSIALSATAHNNIVVFGYRFSNKRFILCRGVLVYTGFIREV